MEALTWTGPLGALLNPIIQIVTLCFLIAIAIQIIGTMALPSARGFNSDGSIQIHFTTRIIDRVVKYCLYGFITLLSLYVIIGAVLGASSLGIIGGISRQLLPIWMSMIAIFTASIIFKRKLGLYGKLFDSPIGMIGFALVIFWVLVTLLAGGLDMVVTHDELSQVSGMKNKVPGTPVRGAEVGDYAHYLLGGDNLARDVFSRAIKGSAIVIVIAPAATLFAFMVGITLGLPAGYYESAPLHFKTKGFYLTSGIALVFSILMFAIAPTDIAILITILSMFVIWMLLKTAVDTVISFLANLILAFPVILLFFLLVTPEIVKTGLPNYMAMILFIFPVVFFGVLLNARFHTRPDIRWWIVGGVTLILFWFYLSMVSEIGSPVYILPNFLDGISLPSEILVVFVSVVFVNSPTVFRIVRGLTLDIKTRDYVAAAQTRGESSWYIMLWEILPNVRGPLIVDFCLRIGYTTILLGTLGFFGLGLESESPDWGTTINAGRRLLSIAPVPALVPALALMSLVLGLNLLADGLREESLKD
jgi:peptide/nickel transport system permease protein